MLRQDIVQPRNVVGIPFRIAFSMRNSLVATFWRGPALLLAMIASSSSAVVLYLYKTKHSKLTLEQSSAPDHHE